MTLSTTQETGWYVHKSESADTVEYEVLVHSGDDLPTGVVICGPFETREQAEDWVALDRNTPGCAKWCFDPLPEDANGWYATTGGYVVYVRAGKVTAKYSHGYLSPIDGVGLAGPFDSPQAARKWLDALPAAYRCIAPDWYVYTYRQTGTWDVVKRGYSPAVDSYLDADKHGPFPSREAAENWVVTTIPNLQTESTTVTSPRPRLDLLPTAPLEEVAYVLAHGAEKHGTHNWCNGTRWGRVYRAVLSHAWAWWRGVDIDPDSGRSHLAHCICNLLFLMEYQRNGWGEDDRFRAPTGAPFKKDDGLQ